MRLNDQQFLAVVGVIIVVLIAYLTYERFRECQDLGGSHCYLGRRLPPARAGAEGEEMTRPWGITLTRNRVLA